MLETLEHAKNPLQAMTEAFRVLQPGDLVVISSGMDFPVHEYPADYWRFTPQAFDLLFECCAPCRVYVQGSPCFPHSLAGVGFKAAPGETAEGLPVRLCGAHRREALDDILAAHDVFVIPSICEETCSFVTREALSAGLRVITSRRGALPEAIQDGENGFLFEPENASDLRRCLRCLIEEPK